MPVTLVCPKCSNVLLATKGGLFCDVHGLYAHDSRGFIRFLEDQSHYFSEHWSKNQLEELPASKLLVAKKFLEPLLKNILQGRILDVGTGDGVHLFHLQQAAPKLEGLGLDISASALATCSQHVEAATLIQADAQCIPLPNESVEAAFSYGVLAYLPNPWLGLAEMVRVTKQDGLVGLWICPKNTSLLGHLFILIRRLVPRLNRFWQARVADIIVPFLGLLPTASAVYLGNANWAACREIVLVNIAPPHLIFPTRKEVLAHLHSLGCSVLMEDISAPITLWAIKGKAPCA